MVVWVFTLREKAKKRAQGVFVGLDFTLSAGFIFRALDG